MSSDLLKDLERFSGAITRHKSTGGATSQNESHRSNTYVNPHYKKPRSQPYPPRAVNVKPVPFTVARIVGPSPKKEVVIGGVAFEASRHKLTRKDGSRSSSIIYDTSTHDPLSAPSSSSAPPFNTTATSSLQHNQNKQSKFTYRTAPIRSQKYKPRSVPGSRSKNLTLNSSNRVNRHAHMEAIRKRKAAKQCRFFVQTGICGRGKQCPYQHDPKKLAICHKFMKGECPHDPAHCLLSHEPTPERVPICFHFANSGRCNNGDKCLYPHFHIGPREGVCKDFAVLGYCDKGLVCEKQHLKECPAFAEDGKCTNTKCKLPHVIRSNANRSTGAAGLAVEPTKGSKPAVSTLEKSKATRAKKEPRLGISFNTMQSRGSAEPADADKDVDGSGDLQSNDYIPLTFEESSDDDNGEDDEEDGAHDPEDEEQDDEDEDDDDPQCER